MLFDEELRSLAARVIDENRAVGRRIATAESCTGGLVSGLLTEIPGSSDVVDRGFVTYSNEAKREMLGVHADVIDTFGAVSVATAWNMALGALENSQADIAVAVTGIAGPDGGSDMKPVGTVVFACARRGDNPAEAKADERVFPDEGRTAVRLQAVRCALELLLSEEAGTDAP